MLLMVLFLVGSIALGVLALRLSQRPSYRRELGQMHAAVEDLKTEVGKALLPAMQRVEKALARFAR